MTLGLLLDSALRSLLLGAMVWTLLRVLRLRDSRTELVIWVSVLIAALCMPLLIKALPGIALPSVSFSWVSHSLFHAKAGPPVVIVISTSAEPAAWPLHAWAWLTAHNHILLWSGYGSFVLVSLARLITGLFLTARLYGAANPIETSWAAGKAIRASAAVSGPISFGRRILLPADYAEWPQTKLLAVLAHEQNHVERGDFFILLLAALHRAVFWFSPFAWWLQARLCALAETASDEAAAQLLDDRATYAEILLDVSQRARRIPALIAMARGPDIHWRVDRILDEAPARTLGLRTRMLGAAAILPAACLIASAHAAIPAAPRLINSFPTARVETATPTVTAAAQRSVTPAARPRKIKVAKAVPAEPDVTYNPRALLDDPEAAVLPMLVTTSTHDKKKNSGGEAVMFMNNLSNN